MINVITELNLLLQNKHIKDNIKDYMKEFSKIYLKSANSTEDLDYSLFDTFIEEAFRETITYFPQYEKELRTVNLVNQSSGDRKELEEYVKVRVLRKYVRATCLKNDLQEYCNNSILKNIFLDFAFYDKLFKEDNKEYLYLLNELFQVITVYTNIYKRWNLLYKEKNSIDRTIALSSSNTTAKMVAPARKIIKDGSYLTNNPSNKILNIIFDSYMDDPYEISYVLSVATGGMKYYLPSLEPYKIQAFEQGAQFFNASMPVQKKDIIKSFQIVVSWIFGKMNKTRHQKLQSKKIISNSKLSEHIKALTYELFKSSSSISPKKMNNPIQLRTFFEKVPLYEYVNKRNRKVFPPFKDDKFFIELTDFLKGKISTKSTKKD